MSRNPQTAEASGLGRFPWGACVALLTLAACGPAVRAADGPAERRQKIEMMSESERIRLARNFKHFKELSEADRERYRQLHRDLQADPQLQTVMDRYAEWIKTLDVDRKDQLRAQKDPVRRRELVAKFREEQANRRPLGVPRGGHWEGPFADFIRRGASQADLNNVMSLLEFKLTSARQVTPEQLSRLKELSGFRHHYYLLDLVVTPPVAGQNEPPKQMLREIFPEILEKAADPQHHQSLRKYPRLLYEWLAFGMRNELHAELEQPETGDKVFEQCLAELNPTDREKVNQMEPAQRKNSLESVYWKKIWEIFGRANPGGGPPWWMRGQGRPGTAPPGEPFRGRRPGEGRDRAPDEPGGQRPRPPAPPPDGTPPPPDQN
jgi:hypothetical protein